MRKTDEQVELINSLFNSGFKEFYNSINRERLEFMSTESIRFYLSATGFSSAITLSVTSEYANQVVDATVYQSVYRDDSSIDTILENLVDILYYELLNNQSYLRGMMDTLKRGSVTKKEVSYYISHDFIPQNLIERDAINKLKAEIDLLNDKIQRLNVDNKYLAKSFDIKTSMIRKERNEFRDKCTELEKELEQVKKESLKKENTKSFLQDITNFFTFKK